MKTLFALLCFTVLINTTFAQSVEVLKAKLKNEKNALTISSLHADIGQEYYHQGNFKLALQHFFKSADAAQKVNARHNIASAYQNIGSTYRETEQYKESEKYLKKAQKIFKSLNENEGLGHTYSSMGNLYYMQYLDSMSEVCYLKALVHFKNAKDTVNLMNTYKNLGALYFEMGDSINGTGIMEKSVLFLSSKDTLYSFDVYVSLAELYVFSGNLIKAKYYLDKCTELLPHIKAIHIIDDYYYALHIYHKKRGKFEDALTNYEKYKVYQDSVFDTENKNHLSELNIKYESKQKEEQIKLLHAQKENDKLTIHKQQLSIVSILLGLIVLLTLVYFLFMRYRKKQDIKRQFEIQNQKETERMRIARDMHDEIGAGLTRIVMNSQQAKTLINLSGDSTNGMTNTLQRIESESRQLSHNIGEIIWALNPKNDRLDSMLAYLRNYAYDFLEDAGIECNIHFPDQVPDKIISTEFRRNVFLILKEALNNMVKHANATKAEIIIKISANFFSLRIEDNGRGMHDMTKSSFGNGLSNMKKRAEESGGTFEFKNNPSDGFLIVVGELPF